MTAMSQHSCIWMTSTPNPYPLRMWKSNFNCYLCPPIIWFLKQKYICNTGHLQSIDNIKKECIMPDKSHKYQSPGPVITSYPPQFLSLISLNEASCTSPTLHVIYHWQVFSPVMDFSCHEHGFIVSLGLLLEHLCPNKGPLQVTRRSPTRHTCV